MNADQTRYRRKVHARTAPAHMGAAPTNRRTATTHSGYSVPLSLGAFLATFAVACALLVTPAMASPLFDAIKSVFAGNNDAATVAETSGNKVVDADTSGDYTAVFNESVTTDAIGEILTDKSVSATDDGFDVVLSASSSTSNVTTTVTKPLDIVLVLDVSGSMDYDFNGRQTVQTSAKKITALKNAANNFIDQIAEKNESISEENSKHNVSIVKFAGWSKNGSDYYQGNIDSVGNHRGQNNYNYNEIVSKFTTDANSLKSSINGLRAGGGTAADYGLTLAQRVLDTSNNHGARADSKKIVVFFTDGEPNHGASSFQEGVANTTVAKSKELKDSGATVYSVGVFSGANPSDTSSNFNKYMHGVSSNYPNATSYDNLGTRADKSDYYKAATSADELKKIFDDISEEQSYGTGLPTEYTEKHVHDSGYVIFTDKLGDWMTVDGMKSITYGGQTYTQSSKSTSGGKTTYIFSAEVTSNYKGAESDYEKTNLSNIIITVTPGSGSNGDTVEVKIPASLIPLTNYEYKDGTYVSKTDAAPVQVTYGVKLKDAVDLNNPTGDFATWLSNNTKDGKVSFYANAWTNGQAGDTTATFTSAKGNNFYNNDKSDNKDKVDNTTATGTAVRSTSVTKNDDKTCTVTTKLGNNGKVTYAVPGKLSISKTVNVAENQGLDKSKYANTEFSFKIKLNDETISGDYTATGAAEKVTFTNGEATVSLKDGQTVTINGLPAGATYTVTEENLPSGFTNSAKSGDTGSITANTTAAASFTNTYSVNPVKRSVTADVKVEKELTGRDLKADEFEFQLKDSKGNVVKTAKNAADGSVSFGEIEYTAAGTYTYTVSEVEGSLGGVTYDKSTYIVTVTVSDDGKGGLSAKAVCASGDITFKNIYAPGETTLKGATNLVVTKTLSGREWQDGDSFEFTIAASGDTQAAVEAGTVVMGDPTVVTITNTTEGYKAAFGDITFKAAGDYEFSVTETKGSLGGVTYDETAKTVKVHVEDNKTGKLVATLAEGSDALSFTNTYKTGESVTVEKGVEVTKNLVGRDWKSTDAFTFTIKADSNTADIEVSEMPLPAETTATAATDGEHKAVFGTMTFTKEGTYTYKVTENQDALPGGVTAADKTQEATVTITVFDNKRGALTASVEVTNGTFTNTYKPGSVTLKGETAIKGQKTLAGHDLTAAKEFGFTLAPVEDYGEKVTYGENAMNATASVQKKDETKDFTFGDITFNEAGEYTFNVTENGATETVAGWTLDNHTSTVTVSVADPDEDGQLKAYVTYGDGDLCKFTNTYTLQPTTVIGAEKLAGTKSLTGRTLNADEFTFTIAVGEGSAENTPLPSSTTATNAADGSFNFGNITFTEPGTYYYSIAEVTDGLADKGITAKTGAKQVKIVVTDNNAGQLVAEVTQPEGGLAFENAYKPESVSTSVSVHKSITADEGLNKPELEGGDFDFTISAAEGTPLPTETTKSNDASGNVTFGEFNFTKEDLGDEMEKTFTYTVTESADKTKPGVTNDSASKTFTITVKDNGDGTMTATNSMTTTPVSFVNTYSVTPVDYSVTTDVKVAKELTGRTLNESEFEFQLVDASGNVVDTAKNAADGSVTFARQNYTKPVETTYTIVEVNDGKGGVTYDKSSYTVKVTVTDNGDGTLSAKAELQGAESATFKNSYKAAPTSVTLGAAKVLDGKDLTDGQFSFELKDADGKAIQTVKNAADGSIAFDTIEYTEAGNYTYTISEVNDGQANVTYDSTVYNVAVSVTDEGTGALKASVSYNDGASAPVFTNTYTEPEKPVEPETPVTPSEPKKEEKKALPQTGDASLLQFVSVAAAGGASFLGGFVNRKRNRRH